MCSGVAHTEGKPVEAPSTAASEPTPAPAAEPVAATIEAHLPEKTGEAPSSEPFVFQNYEADEPPLHKKEESEEPTGQAAIDAFEATGTTHPPQKPSLAVRSE